jgi:membrane protein required for colicin V production
MNFTWVDFLLCGIVVAAIVIGLVKGLIRETFSLASVILGLILAGQYYENLATLLRPIIVQKDLDFFVSFLLIFTVVVIVGWLMGGLLSRAAKGPFKFFNHALGAVFGFIKGILISGVVVLALLVFSVDRTAVAKSWMAPYALSVTNGIVELVPQELKARFKEIYADIKGKVGKHGQES